MKRVVWIGLALAVAATASGQTETIGGSSYKAYADGFDPKVDEYVVEKGDTLWDISARVLGDPFDWPKVWALNPEITNPHWIYPGDIVRFYPSTVGLPRRTELVVSSMQMPQDDGPGTDGADAATAPKNARRSSGVQEVGAGYQNSRLARRNKRYIGRFVGRKEMEEAGTLSNASPDKLLLAQGDRVYVTFPKSGVAKQGDRLLTFITDSEVIHPETEELEGYVTQITGLLQIVRVKDKVAEAEILRTNHEVERGQFVAALGKEPNVNLDEVKTDKELKGTILAVRDGRTLFVGDEELVFIDRGTKDGLVLGNRLRVLASGDPLELDKQLPKFPIGLLQVVDAREASATCLVLSADQEIEPGALVETFPR